MKRIQHIKGEVAHIKDNFLPEESAEYLRRLRGEVPWMRAKWGRGFLPRLVFRCDAGPNGPDGWPESIKELKDRTEETFQCTVMAAWCNLYRSGADHTPPHQDQYNAHVITWSFGGSRRFITDTLGRGEKTKYVLADGDVFYFSPGFDARHKHSIPKTAKAVDVRVSIVFFSDQPYCGSHWHTQIDRPFGLNEDMMDDEFLEGVVFGIEMDETGKVVAITDADGVPIDILQENLVLLI